MQSDPARFHFCDPNHPQTSPRFQTVLALPEAALVLYLGPIALSLSGIAPETNQAPFEGRRPIRVCSRPGPFPLLLGVADMAPYPQPPPPSIPTGSTKMLLLEEFKEGNRGLVRVVTKTAVSSSPLGVPLRTDRQRERVCPTHRRWTSQVSEVRADKPPPLTLFLLLFCSVDLWSILDSAAP